MKNIIARIKAWRQRPAGNPPKTGVRRRRIGLCKALLGPRTRHLNPPSIYPAASSPATSRRNRNWIDHVPALKGFSRGPI
jgi:hypothetical protein